jgi:GDP-L-fucose synthase
MKILITGGSGFLGKNLQKHFEHAANYNIVPISSQVYDLRDSYACKKMLETYQPDVVVHAAGSVGGILANQKNPGKFMYDNLAMGMNMLERSRQYRDKYKNIKFIMLGTVCAYPKHTPVPFKESGLWDGYPEETNAPYGIAKKTLMKLGETYHEQYGMNIINLIPVNMYGPHDHFNLTTSHVIPALIMKFYNATVNYEKSVTVWGTGEASREFLYAPDCATAIECAIKSDVGPEPINIGTGQEIKIKDLVKEIAEQMNYGGEILFDPSKPDGQPRRCLDTTKAEELIGFKASTNFKNGLMNTIKWFLQTEVQK